MDKTSCIAFIDPYIEGIKRLIQLFTAFTFKDTDLR